MRKHFLTAIAVATSAFAFIPISTPSHAGSSGGFFEWLATPPERPSSDRQRTRQESAVTGSQSRQQNRNQAGTRYDYRTYRDANGNIDWNAYALNRVSTQEATSTGTTRTEVDFHGSYEIGSIVIDTSERHLYYVLPGGRAYRYDVGVGRPGFEWYGTHAISRKSEWPDWRPPEEMRQRQPELPEFMPGGPGNPLGARALYLGSTLYRIHGTTENHTIGYAVSSGCIRMLNEDVMDLYNRVNVGTVVHVRA
jgi:lipoprotein-anchoring transpeptidase ErfK/SrfK